jgi:hypothetical protein
MLKHPPYLPVLTQNDSILFLKVKDILKGRHFDDIDDIKNNTTALKPIPQNQSQNCFEGGLGAGIDAQLPEGSTLKAATVIFSNGHVTILPL